MLGGSVQGFWARERPEPRFKGRKREIQRQQKGGSPQGKASPNLLPRWILGSRCTATLSNHLDLENHTRTASILTIRKITGTKSRFAVSGGSGRYTNKCCIRNRHRPPQPRVKLPGRADGLERHEAVLECPGAKTLAGITRLESRQGWRPESTCGGGSRLDSSNPPQNSHQDPWRPTSFHQSRNRCRRGRKSCNLLSGGPWENRPDPGVKAGNGTWGGRRRYRCPTGARAVVKSIPPLKQACKP